MSSRLYRIAKKELSSKVDQQLTFILQNGSVLLAKLISIESEIAVVRNTRNTKVSLSMTDISEIWQDSKSL